MKVIEKFSLTRRVDWTKRFPEVINDDSPGE